MDGRKGITLQIEPQNRKTGRFPDAQSFGEFLRNLRQRHGVSLGHIAEQTRIAVTKFEALERGDLQRLPTGLYGRAVVRAYATAIGLDPVEIVTEFQHLVPGEEMPLPSPEQLKPPAADGELPRWVGSVAAALILGVSYSALAYWTAPPTIPEEQVIAESVPVSPDPTEPEVAATTGDATPLTNVQLAANEAAPPEPPQAVESTLTVTSNPAGARVTVNGIGWGETPVTIRYLPPGSKTVRVTKDGFEGAEKKVVLAEEGPASVRLNLEPLTIP
jgi:cytoskeletal protein RodZ